MFYLILKFLFAIVVTKFLIGLIILQNKLCQN